MEDENFINPLTQETEFIKNWDDYFKWLMETPNPRISFGGWDWKVKNKTKTSINLFTKLGEEEFILTITKAGISALYYSAECGKIPHVWELENPTLEVISDWLQEVAMECAFL